MDPERYQLVKQAFAEVSRAPAAEREEALRRVCGDDEELRREVESLLEHDRSAPGGILADKTTPRPDSGSRPGSAFAGDFAPGQVLIGRYRIVALIGEGGMGQVYLADDLVLGQPVAVKFLPEHLAESAGGLERFRAEVRHARVVTHPNVARVHDIGEVHGRHFLTMEYVDGEDLASLVKRIGRLPHEKADEIAQQICAGLAEAHHKGVLHRDLKPANVMLDGEGRVRLTDFGLAVAAEAEGEPSLAGTPQYMAPEQLAGLPATEQSEVYSLGLLLYELYTGQRALRGHTLEELRREHEGGSIRPPSSALANIEEAVDQAITRCLARDPKERPSSVLEVARALPGGDPLAAALAAGVTPSPEVVAAAGSRGALAPRRALALLLGTVALFLARIEVHYAAEKSGGNSYGKPAAVLREQARQLTAELIGDSDLAHEIHWYVLDWDVFAAQHPSGLDAAVSGGTLGPRSSESVAAPAMQAVVHHSRFGPEPFAAQGNWVTQTDPAPVPGSVHVALDAEGTLVRWERRIPGDDPGSDAPVPESVWTALLAHAGFDRTALRPTEPRELPPVFASERRAWEGAGPDAQEGLLIEAGGAAGRPVFLSVTRHGTTLGAWTRPSPFPGSVSWFLLAVTGLAAILALHNVRAGRADARGALLVGGFALVTHVVVVLGRPLPDEFAAFGSRLFEGVSYALHTAVNVTVFYLALEPFARRHWPDSMISWSRLLNGRLRDPAVGREVLIGMFAAPMVFWVITLVSLGLEAAGLPWSLPPPVPNPAGLGGPLQPLAHVVHLAGDIVLLGGLVVLFLLLLRALVRIAWLANGLWLALPLGLLHVVDPEGLGLLFVWAMVSSTFLLLLSRVGFLSAVLFLFTYVLPFKTAMTLRPSDWYFSSSLVILLAMALLAVWAYKTSIAGRSVFESRAA